MWVRLARWRLEIQASLQGERDEGHLRMFAARATTMVASKRLGADWTIKSSFTRWLSGIVSVGAERARSDKR
jgi:hypothetical protein